MPFISSVRSSYGTSGKKKSSSAIGKLRRELGSNDITYSPGTIKIIDLRGTFGSSDSITVYAKGGNGGDSGARGGYGTFLQGTVPVTQLAGKRIALISGSNGVNGPGGRGSAGGGGYSGIIVLDNANSLRTIAHIATAAGAGGASGPGDSGGPSNGYDTSSIVYGGSPTAGSGGLAKDSGGTTGFYPSLSFAARPGNAFGGGDSCSNENGRDNFAPGGGGGFGYLSGGSPSNASGPGMLNGNPSAGDYSTLFAGGFGGGGGSTEGGSGGQTWRTQSGGGGGGGFIGGNGGGFISDETPSAGFAGTSFWFNSSNVVSHSPANSNAPYLRIVV
jgi:hypothetical protein